MEALCTPRGRRTTPRMRLLQQLICCHGVKLEQSAATLAANERHAPPGAASLMPLAHPPAARRLRSIGRTSKRECEQATGGVQP